MKITHRETKSPYTPITPLPFSSPEVYNTLLQEEFVSPSQFFTPFPSSPVIPLFTAILSDALNLAYKAQGKKPRLAIHKDALAWINAPSSTWLFSFSSICTILGIDAAQIQTFVRAGMPNWKQWGEGERSRRMRQRPARSFSPLHLSC